MAAGLRRLARLGLHGMGGGTEGGCRREGGREGGDLRFALPDNFVAHENLPEPRRATANRACTHKLKKRAMDP